MKKIFIFTWIVCCLAIFFIYFRLIDESVSYEVIKPSLDLMSKVLIPQFALLIAFFISKSGKQIDRIINGSFLRKSAYGLSILYIISFLFAVIWCIALQKIKPDIVCEKENGLTVLTNDIIHFMNIIYYFIHVPLVLVISKEKPENFHEERTPINT